METDLCKEEKRGMNHVRDVKPTCYGIYSKLALKCYLIKFDSPFFTNSKANQNFRYCLSRIHYEEFRRASSLTKMLLEKVSPFSLRALNLPPPFKSSFQKPP
ncbi:hypothetical protein VNO77_20115 [Canavalia gladiata]|uniref:Uncharacterized protein n=1 Tax=Canavalia gladiata TaxID=3824 RepID=A0AAN9LNW3_CANGL